MGTGSVCRDFDPVTDGEVASQRRRAIRRLDNELVVLDTGAGTSRSYPSPRPDKLVRLPAVSPDGARVIFQLDNDGAWLLEVADGSMRQVLADPSVRASRRRGVG